MDRSRAVSSGRSNHKLVLGVHVTGWLCWFQGRCLLTSSQIQPRSAAGPIPVVRLGLRNWLRVLQKERASQLYVICSHSECVYYVLSQVAEIH